MRMDLISLGACALIMIGCKVPEGTLALTNAGNGGDKTDFSYWTLDRTQRIVSGDESYAQSANTIKQCANGSDGMPLICYDVCISRFFPQNLRYSFFLSGYVSNNRCFVSILESPSHDGVPTKYEEFEGVYQTYMSGGALRARCTGIDEGVPDFSALHTFSTYSTPSGQPTTNPWGYRTYYLLSLFSDPAQNLLSSTYLQTYQTTEGELVNPSRYSYFENNTSGHEITMTRQNGYDCVKRDEITNTVIQSFQPGS